MYDIIDVELVEKLYEYGATDFLKSLHQYRCITEFRDVIVKKRITGEVLIARIYISEDDNDLKIYTDVDFYVPTLLKRKDFSKDLQGTFYFFNRFDDLCIYQDSKSMFDFLVDYDITEGSTFQYCESIAQTDMFIAFRDKDKAYVSMYNKTTLKRPITLPKSADEEFIKQFDIEFKKQCDKSVLLHELSGGKLPSIQTIVPDTFDVITTNAQIEGRGFVLEMASCVSHGKLPKINDSDNIFEYHHGKIPISFRINIQTNY